MSDQPHYPYADGDIVVLGPQVFASADGETISWQGANYRRDRGTETGGDLRERITKAARTVRLRLGPNAIAVAQRGEPIILNMGEADDLAGAVLAAIQSELDRLADYENRITWHTTCASCARVLDSAIRETERAEQAEAAIARVRALAERWRYTGDRKEGPLRELRAALQPPAHDAGPSVAEAKADDRRWWGGEKTGEGQ